MSAKEEKFWEMLREQGNLWKEIAEDFYQAMDGNASVEICKEIGSMRRRHPFRGSNLAEKLYRAYKDPYRQGEAQRLLYQCEEMLSDGYEILRLLCVIDIRECSKITIEMVRLVAEGLLEWQKLLDYTIDMKTNELRIEARVRKILTFEERSEEFMLQGLQVIYRSENKCVGIYHKEIFYRLENILSMTAQNAKLLSHLLEI